MKCDENTAAIWECKEGDPNKWVFLNYCFTGEKVRNFTRNHGNELNIASPVRSIVSSVTMIHPQSIQDKGALYANKLHKSSTAAPNAVFLLQVALSLSARLRVFASFAYSTLSSIDLVVS
jgi:hypothetical protein